MTPTAFRAAVEALVATDQRLGQAVMNAFRTHIGPWEVVVDDGRRAVLLDDGTRLPDVWEADASTPAVQQWSATATARLDAVGHDDHDHPHSEEMTP